jgi:hypothetical protein
MSLTLFFAPGASLQAMNCWREDDGTMTVQTPAQIPFKTL